MKFIFYTFYLLRFYLFTLEGGEGKEKERERNINVWLPFLRPQLGTWPTVKACALTWNRTSQDNSMKFKSVTCLGKIKHIFKTIEKLNGTEI